MINNQIASKIQALRGIFQEGGTVFVKRDQENSKKSE